MSDEWITTDALSHAVRRRREAQAQAAAEVPTPKGRVWKILRAPAGEVVGYGEPPPEMTIERENGRATKLSVGGRSFKIIRDEAARFSGIEEQ